MSDVTPRCHVAIAQTNVSNTRYIDYTGAHVAHDQSFKFCNHEQAKTKSDCTNLSHNDESNVKDYGCRSRHHHFILSLLVLLFIAINFSPCCYGNNCPLVIDEKSLISNNAANQDFSIMAISTSDDVMCGVTEGSSDNDEMVLSNNAPLFAMFGMDWEILASSPKYSLKPAAGTEMILHPMATYNQQNLMRCKRPGPTLNGRYRCSKLDDTHLNKCTSADNDDQDSNKSSSFCPLRKFNSNYQYLHLYTHYTMISTMKGLLSDGDIISIIVHQKMLQIQQKYFPLVFWLVVIGLTFSYFRIISGMNYDDNNLRRDIQPSQSGANIHDGEMDSVSSLSYHTASDKNYDIGDHDFLDATSESELSDLGLFPAPLPAVSMTNPEHLTYTEAYAHVVLNQPLFFFVVFFLFFSMIFLAITRKQRTQKVAV